MPGGGEAGGPQCDRGARGGGGGGGAGPEVGGGDTGRVTASSSPLGAAGEGGLGGAGEDTQAAGRTGRGPVALPGGLLIMIGGDGGRGEKLEADQAPGFAAGGWGGGAAFTGEEGREFLLGGRGAVA